MPNSDTFEKYFQEYDNWFDENPLIYKSEIKAVKKLLPRGRGLEVGCGTGRFSLPFGIKEGIEPSLEMKAFAEKRGMKVISAAAEEIPVESGVYDYTLLVTTICFLDDINKAFKEIFRILKERGSLVIGFIDRESPVGKVYYNNRDKSPFYRSAKFYSTGEVLDILTKNNFTDFKIVQTIFGNLGGIKKVQKVINGYNEGSFVVIRAVKKGNN